MASAGCRDLPKMAAAGAALRARTAAGARARSRTETRGPALRAGQRRRRPPGCCGKGSPEGGCSATASAQPAGEEQPVAQRQQRGGPRAPSPCSPRKAADGRPSKRRKCEKTSLVKSELEGLACGSGDLAAWGEADETPAGDRSSDGAGGRNVIQQKTGESVPETGKQGKEQASLKPAAVKSSRAPSQMGRGENLHVCSEEERSCESGLSDGSSAEDTDLLEKPVQLDSSAFLNEDSNQPMPVHRFFGDVASLQDLPAAALPSSAMSRREFRKLHCIAKEEEEEEEEDVV